MTKQSYTIPRLSWSSLPPITAEIECAATTPEGVKLGLAVQAAVGRKENLSRANLSGAYLSRANLSGANLSRAYLSGANLSRAYLSRANLSDANLSDANLTGANLSWADLSDANLTDANLSWADLSDANLTGANLSWADLSWANLSRAKIHGEPVARCVARIMRDDGYGFHAMQLETGCVKIMAGCRWFTVAEFRQHVAENYPGQPKAVETLWILDAIERRAADLGIDLEPATLSGEPSQ